MNRRAIMASRWTLSSSSVLGRCDEVQDGVESDSKPELVGLQHSVLPPEHKIPGFPCRGKPKFRLERQFSLSDSRVKLYGGLTQGKVGYLGNTFIGNTDRSREGFPLLLDLLSKRKAGRHG